MFKILFLLSSVLLITPSYANESSAVIEVVENDGFCSARSCRFPNYSLDSIFEKRSYSCGSGTYQLWVDKILELYSQPNATEEGRAELDKSIDTLLNDDAATTAEVFHTFQCAILQLATDDSSIKLFEKNDRRFMLPSGVLALIDRDFSSLQKFRDVLLQGSGGAAFSFEYTSRGSRFWNPTLWQEFRF